MIDELSHQISKIKRIHFANLPTPLEKCDNLSKHLKVNEIFIKRDDLTGLAFGGNKVRHLEFRFGHILNNDFNHIVNANMGISNNSRLWSAASVINNIPLTLIMSDELNTELQGNHLLNFLMDIEIIYSKTQNEEILQNEAVKYGEKLKSQGYKPYITVLEPFNEIAAVLAYINTALELNKQFKSLGLKNIHIFQASGSSYLGMCLAKKILDLKNWKITGIGPRLQPRMRDIRGITNKTLNIFDKKFINKLNFEYLDYNELNWDLRFYGEGYGRSTKESIQSIKLLAELEAIFLDPVYTSKAMSGLIHYAQNKKIEKDASIVFIHSGGLPNVFTYADEYINN